MPDLDLLAIAAHPDDVELTCGGTLIKSARQGYRVGILDLSAGEMASRGSVELRQQEAAESARLMGALTRENLGLPDAGITNTTETRLLLAAVIRRLRPAVVIAPAPPPFGRHPDHRASAELVRDAVFIAGLQRADLSVPPHRPRKILHTIAYREDYVKPTFVVDISAEFETKLAAIACFRSQFEGTTQAGEVYPNGEPLADIVRHQAAHYGALIRRQFGEPFYTTETMQADDVVALPVSTF